MAIITITRQFGSSGADIAKKLRDELGCKYLDRTLLEAELVKTCQFPEKDFEKYDEKKPGFWEAFSADKDRYLHCLKTVLYDFARQGDCIIMGRGGQALFRNLAAVLHVRVFASLPSRIARVKTEYGSDDRLAQQAIQQSDHDRAGFHKFFFQVNWEDADLYHLILNTDIFPLDAAVQVLKKACEVSGVLRTSPESQGKLADLRLTQQVLNRIKYIERIPTEFLDVVAASGAVILRGATVTEEDIKRCEMAAHEVSGVGKVINEMRCVRNPYRQLDRRVEPLS